MKQKLVFYFMLKMRQWSNGMAKAMKLLMLLLASGLMSAPAHSECYNTPYLGGYNFTSYGRGPSCGPMSIITRDFDGYNWVSEDGLWKAYKEMRSACHSHVSNYWNCPVRNRWNNVNQIHSTWQREVRACQQKMDNQYNKYKGKMCYGEDGRLIDPWR